MEMDTLVEAMGDLEEDDVNAMLEQVMDEGGARAAEAMAACQKGMNVVGDRFESGEYFVAGVLTLAIDSMKDTMQALADAGIRDTTRVIVGGVPINEDACKVVGADAWVTNPQVTVNTCQKWAAA